MYLWLIDPVLALVCITASFAFYSENSDVSRNEALIYGTCLFALMVCYGITLLHYLFKGMHYSMKIRVALSSVIYRKVC